MVSLAKYLVLSSLFAILCACKIVVTAPMNSAVVSESGTFRCEPRQECKIDVVDVFFDETFIVKPEPGYEFVEWRRRNNGLCGGRNDPCRLATTGFVGHDAFVAFLETDESFFLEPVVARTINPAFFLEYRDIGEPIVRDANGVAIGSLPPQTQGKLSTDISVHFKGISDTYTLRIIPFIYFIRREEDRGFDIVYTEDGDCYNAINPLSPANEDGSESTKVYSDTWNNTYIATPGKMPQNDQITQIYRANGFGCYPRAPEAAALLYSLEATDLRLAMPFTVDGSDVVIDSNRQLIE